jgi:hypothetical protein
MTTYYTIHMQDLPSGMENNNFSNSVYESFDDACDALEKEIVNHDIDFVKLDRTALREMRGGCLVYHTAPFKMFGLMERKFVSKKQVLYSYTADSGSQRVYTSIDFTSLDQICDRLDIELEVDSNMLNCHRIYATRPEIKKLLERKSSIAYGIWDDGKGAPITYTLRKH